MIALNCCNIEGNPRPGGPENCGERKAFKSKWNATLCKVVILILANFLFNMNQKKTLRYVHNCLYSIHAKQVKHNHTRYETTIIRLIERLVLHETRSPQKR